MIFYFHIVSDAWVMCFQLLSEHVESFQTAGVATTSTQIAHYYIWLFAVNEFTKKNFSHVINTLWAPKLPDGNANFKHTSENDSHIRWNEWFESDLSCNLNCIALRWEKEKRSVRGFSFGFRRRRTMKTQLPPSEDHTGDAIIIVTYYDVYFGGIWEFSYREVISLL